MPRGNITKAELKVYIEKLKTELYNTQYSYNSNSKELAHKYLNKIFDKIDEYRE